MRLFLILFTLATIPAFGSLEKILVTSTPSDSSVFVETAYVGTTPLMIELDTNKTYNMTIAKNNHLPHGMKLKGIIKKYPLYIAMPGGAILFAIDALRGAVRSFPKNKVHVTLPIFLPMYKAEMPREEGKN